MTENSKSMSAKEYIQHAAARVEAKRQRLRDEGVSGVDLGAKWREGGYAVAAVYPEQMTCRLSGQPEGHCITIDAAEDSLCIWSLTRYANCATERHRS